MLEKEVEAKLVSGVKKMGGIAYKFVSPGNAGVPDRIVILPDGRVIFVELKTASGRLSALQQRQIARIAKAGGQVRVVYGKSGVDDFLKYAAGGELHDVQTTSVSGFLLDGAYKETCIRAVPGYGAGKDDNHA